MNKKIAAACIAGYLIVCMTGFRIASAEEIVPSANQAKSSGNAITIYYFYTNVRCPTCHKLEKYTQEAVTEYFADLVKQGAVIYKTINTDEKGNEHFLKDYGLFTKSVIVAEEQDGQQKRWKNLDKIWELVGDKDKYLQYIQNEVKAYIEAK